MGSSRRPGGGHQRGVSLIGLLFWAIIIGFIGYVAVRVLPTLNEYFTIQSAVNKIAAGNPSTVGEIRRSSTSRGTSSTRSRRSPARTSTSPRKTTAS